MSSKHEELVKIVSNWLSCFYVDDRGRIGLDLSVHPPFGMFYRDLFWVVNGDGETLAALVPDQRRYVLTYIALMLVIAPVAVCYEVTGKGKMLLRQDSMALKALIPDRFGNPVTVHVQSILAQKSEYSSFYDDDSLYELTTIYNKLNNFAWNLTPH